MWKLSMRPFSHGLPGRCRGFLIWRSFNQSWMAKAMNSDPLPLPQSTTRRAPPGTAACVHQAVSGCRKRVPFSVRSQQNPAPHLPRLGRAQALTVCAPRQRIRLCLRRTCRPSIRCKRRLGFEGITAPGSAAVFRSRHRWVGCARAPPSTADTCPKSAGIVHGAVIHDP